ncbi:MAG: DNA-binding response regulator [Herbinix sp.]|nr:DNA-binding response regulator [Herbinix sp.]
MRLLIVDDDTLILKSLSLTLSREEDIDIIGCATDGAEAIKICEEQSVDIVLMDIRMPGIDGISATKLVKQRYPNTRVMMLTTFDDKPNIQQALSAGADGYLARKSSSSATYSKRTGYHPACGTGTFKQRYCSTSIS